MINGKNNFIAKAVFLSLFVGIPLYSGNVFGSGKTSLGETTLWNGTVLVEKADGYAEENVIGRVLFPIDDKHHIEDDATKIFLVSGVNTFGVKHINLFFGQGKYKSGTTYEVARVLLPDEKETVILKTGKHSEDIETSLKVNFYNKVIEITLNKDLTVEDYECHPSQSKVNN
jgi:hypothetical protein